MSEKKSHCPSSKGRLRVVHPALPVFLTVLCLVVAVKLVPDKRELAKRQLKDGSDMRGLQTAMSLDSEPEPETAAKVDSKQARRTLEEALLAPAKLRELVSTPEGRAELAEGVLESDDYRQQITELSEHAKILNREDHEKLLRCVANRAINAGQPKLAALIFTKLMQLRPETMSQDMVEDVVRSWRANDQATEALACLQTWIAHASSNHHEVPEHLEHLYISLLFESNKAGDALDMLLEKLVAQKKAGKISPGLLASAIEAGNYSGRVKELRPFLADALAEMPLGKASIEEVCAAVKVGDGPLLADREQWSKSALELAHWYEWSETPDPSNSEKALAIYEKLAALGNREALQKAVDMSADLQSMGDLVPVMDLVMHQPKPPPLEFAYGHLLGVAGRLEEADHYFSDWLKFHPRDLHALSEYASLCQERDDLVRAQATWKLAADQVHQRQMERSSYWEAKHQWCLPGGYVPEQMEYRKREAEADLELQRNADALAIYQSFKAHEHDNTTLENMALLAESLGEYESLNRALLMRFTKLPHPTVNDYLELARSYGLSGNEEQRLHVLYQGVTKLPDSLNLRRQCAFALQEAERSGEAVDLLEFPSTKTDLRSLSLYIVAASQSEQFARAAEFLKDEIGHRRDFPADVRLHLGHICQQTSQFDLARGYYASVDSNAVTWPLLAEACYELGAYAEAEKYQRRYLEDMENPPADQLIFLGDICRMMGREEAAQSAYDLAVESIRSKHKEVVEPPQARKVSASASP